MSTLTLSQLSLLELAKRSNNGNLVVISETLSQINEILQDAQWVEANEKTKHIGTRRRSLPTGTLRNFNAGVAPDASTTMQIEEPLAQLEAYSIVDTALAGLSGRPDEFRSGEDMAFVEGMSQTVCGKLFYANNSSYSAKDILGFAPKYNSSSYSNVYLTGGGGSDVTSVWVIDWDPVQGVHCTYPQGSQGGLLSKDLGIRPAYDSSYYAYEAYWTHFKWDFGIFVHDDRQIQRIANIETSGTANIFDEDYLIKALNRMRIPGGGPNSRIYVDRTVKTQMDILAKNKPNVWHTVEDPWGRPITMFRGIPVRLVDQLLDTETAIS